MGVLLRLDKGYYRPVSVILCPIGALEQFLCIFCIVENDNTVPHSFRIKNGAYMKVPASSRRRQTMTHFYISCSILCMQGRRYLSASQADFQSKGVV